MQKRGLPDIQYKVRDGVDLLSFELDSTFKYIISFKPTGLVCEMTETGFTFISYLTSLKSTNDAIKKFSTEYDGDTNEIVNDAKLLITKLLDLGFLEAIE